MTTPLPKSNSLVDKLNKLLDSETKSEFELKQIEHEAKKLMSIDPAAAHLVLGMLCSLKNDKTGSSKHHELALKLGCDRFLGHRNFSVSLANMGYLSDGLEYARQAYRIEKNPETIQTLVSLNFRCGRIEESLRYFHELQKLNVAPSFFNNLPIEENLNALASFMQKNAIRDSDLASFTGVMEEIAHQYELDTRAFAYRIIDEHGDEWLSIDINVDASPREIATINISVADNLVQAGTMDALLDKVSCKFSPFTKMIASNGCQ